MRRYGVPITTVRRYISRNMSAVDQPSKARRYLSHQQEQDLIKYIIFMGDHSMPLTTTDIVRVAGRLTAAKTPSRPPPTLRWAQKLLKRHNLSLKVPNLIHHGRAAAATEAGFQQHFDVLEKLYKDFKFSSSCIVNMNETGWSKEQQRRVAYRRGAGRPNMKKAVTSDHITSVNAVAANGTVLNTMIIFRKNEPYFDSLPSNIITTSSDSGFINTELFIHWLKSVLIPFCTSRSRSGPFLLTMDNASPHISYEAVMLCLKYNIHIFCLLPNASGWLQPLDQIFDPLKKELSTVAHRLQLALAGYITNKFKFPYLLNIALRNCFTADFVKSSFCKTGIYPFDRDAPDRTGVTSIQQDQPEQSNENSEITSDWFEPVQCAECERTVPCSTCLRNANPLRDLKLLEDPLCQAVLHPPPLPPPKRKRVNKPKARHLTGKCFELELFIFNNSTFNFLSCCGCVKNSFYFNVFMSASFGSPCNFQLFKCHVVFKHNLFRGQITCLTSSDV